MATGLGAITIVDCAELLQPLADVAVYVTVCEPTPATDGVIVPLGALALQVPPLGLAVNTKGVVLAEHLGPAGGVMVTVGNG